jgi:hypothetical protein
MIARRRGGGAVGVVVDEGVGAGLGVCDCSDPVGCVSTAPKNRDKVPCKVSTSLSYQDPA